MILSIIERNASEIKLDIGLKDHMKEVGDVEYCDVLVGKDGRSNGSGLVRFATAEQAEKAISDLTNTDLDGRQIFVREDK